MSQKLFCVNSRRNRGIRPAVALVESVGGDPTAHHHHWHSGPGMRRPSRQIETLEIRTRIRRFERAVPTSVTRNAVDRSIEHLVALMDIDRRQGALKNNPLLNIGQTSGTLELVEDHLAVSRKYLRPIVLRTQKRGVHQHVEGI